MTYLIKPSKRFQKDFKRLGKKYKSLADDVAVVTDDLHENPTLGESLGQNCYKIRVAIKSKNKGKSGGARLITCVYFFNRSDLPPHDL